MPIHHLKKSMRFLTICFSTPFFLMSLVVYQALGPLAREEKFTRAKPTSIRPLRPTSRSISVQRGEAVLVAASSRVSSEENRERDRIPHSKRGFCCCPGQEEAARRGAMAVGDLAFKALTAGLGVATLYLAATFSVNVYRGLSWHSEQSVSPTPVRSPPSPQPR
jgi:hypothetical protein